jgi:hypothetical protein
LIKSDQPVKEFRGYRMGDGIGDVDGIEGRRV